MKHYVLKDGTEVTQDEYLYGDVEVPDIPSHIIMRRIEALDDNLADLLETSIKDRDSLRVDAVVKAKAFWNKLRR